MPEIPAQLELPDPDETEELEPDTEPGPLTGPPEEDDDPEAL